MDPGANIYARILAAATAHLSRVNPKLTKDAIDWNTKTFDTEGIRYAFEGGTLTVTEAQEKHRPILYYTLMSVAEAHEKQYGIAETWMPLKQTILKVMQGSRDEIRDLDLEVPIGKYPVSYTLLESLFGLNATDFRTRKWKTDPVTVTNQKATFTTDTGTQDISYQSMATVDREIYIGYNSEGIRGEIRAIDFQRQTQMSCIIVLAKRDLMRDFMKVITVMRGEFRRLSPQENSVLIALYNSTDIKELAKFLSIQQAEAEKSLKKIISAGYADEKGHLTSYGINAAIQTIKTPK